MKEELKRKEVTRGIGNGFDVRRKYRVGLGWKNMENWEKTHILGNFGGPVPVHLEPVPVQVSRTEPVPVQVRPLPVHPALF